MTDSTDEVDRANEIGSKHKITDSKDKIDSEIKIYSKD